jgi:ABC-type multidrug transport system fused ATPase/permease subunit
VSNSTFSYGDRSVLSETDKAAAASSKESKESKDSPFYLRNLDFTVIRGELVGIAGPVGSGKTSLLLACLGELKLVSGAGSRVHGTIAFVPQEPWIFSGSVRANICFGKQLDRLYHIF